MPDEVAAWARELARGAGAAAREWRERFEAYAAAYPEDAAELRA